MYYIIMCVTWNWKLFLPPSHLCPRMTEEWPTKNAKRNNIWMQKNKCNRNVMHICMLCSRFTELNYGFPFFYLNMHARKYLFWSVCLCVRFLLFSLLSFFLILLFKVISKWSQCAVRQTSSGAHHATLKGKRTTIGGLECRKFFLHEIIVSVMQGEKKNANDQNGKIQITSMYSIHTYNIPKPVTCYER